MSGTTNVGYAQSGPTRPFLAATQERDITTPAMIQESVLSVQHRKENPPADSPPDGLGLESFSAGDQFRNGATLSAAQIMGIPAQPV